MCCQQLCLKEMTTKLSKAYNAKVTVTFLEQPHWASSSVSSPHTHSPDLAPCEVGWRIFSRTQYLSKAVNSELHALFPFKLSKCLWILAQTTGTVCAKWRRELSRNVNVVGKSDRHLLTCEHHWINSPRTAINANERDWQSTILHTTTLPFVLTRHFAINVTSCLIDLRTLLDKQPSHCH